MRENKDFAKAVACAEVALVTYDLIKVVVKVAKEKHVLDKVGAQLNKFRLVKKTKNEVSEEEEIL
jgi:hypothetical protein